MSSTNSALLQIAAPEPEDDSLSQRQKELIVEGLYEGKTLVYICKELGISRASVDIEEREDKEFREALGMGRQAMADVNAEKVFELTLATAQNPKLRRADKMRMLALVWKQTEFFATRAGRSYTAKAPTKVETKKAKRLKTHVPRAQQ